MCRKFTPDELNTMDHESKNDVIYQMQDRLDRLEHDYENLMEQVRLANQQRFGRNTEKLDEIAGQLSFFNEAEANCDENVPEPTIEETVASAMKPPRKHKKKGLLRGDRVCIGQHRCGGWHDTCLQKGVPGWDHPAAVLLCLRICRAGEGGCGPGIGRP